MKYAVCFGIDDYPGTNMDLSQCVRDAKGWGKAFSDRGFEVSLFLNAKAVRTKIIKALEDVVAKAVSGDLIAIQYSGHGTYVASTDKFETDGRDECWVPYDIMENGPITDNEVYAILSKRAKGVKIVVFSDSCHSGTMLRAFDSPSKGVKKFLPPRIFLGKSKKINVPEEHVMEEDAGFAETDGIILLFGGCQDNQYSMDVPELKHGAFTYYALKALDEIPDDATYGQWYKKICEYLPSPDFDQSPTLYGAGKRSKIFT